MLTQNFYQLLDSELDEVLASNPEDAELHKHKDKRHNKGYALLVWFLQFYGQKKHYPIYITDGNGDSSCDIIFSNQDTQKQTIFYVVQSKYLQNNKGVLPQINKEEFNATLSDFNTILKGTRRESENPKFNEKHKELIKHLEANGKAKFIFFTLAEPNPAIADNIASFNKENSPHVSLDVIDINQIKRDYIEFRFKEIVSGNRLEYAYNPEDSQITIDIESFEKGENRHLLQYEGRFQSYIFVLKPKTVHALFDRYRFNLFFKNVRNPLKKSIYNEKIVETLLKQPDAFWYFNNGITGITSQMPTIGKNAKRFTIEGLQVINGAQTVYSIYDAYEKASPAQRKMMDTDARVSFRLIRSSDERFNQEITRYTNSQNQILERDFVANDDIQQRLQDESFQTNYWYEKRRDEFRLTQEEQGKRGVQIIPNQTFAIIYLAVFLQKPYLVNNINNKVLFIKRTQNAEGLYEMVFNEQTKFKDMLVSFYLYQFCEEYRKNRQALKDKFQKGITTKKRVLRKYMSLDDIIFYAAFLKMILSKYFEIKYKSKIVNISKNIIDIFEGKLKSHNISHIALGLDAFLHYSGRQYSQSQTQYDIICQQIEEMSEDEFMQWFEGSEEA